MFGIGKNPDGTYYDSLAPQLSSGGPKGNPEGIAKICTPEYFRKQWIDFINAQFLPDIRKKVLLGMIAENPTLKSLVDSRTEVKISQKAQELVEKEIAQGPPIALIDQQLRTPEYILNEWMTFMHSEFCLPSIWGEVCGEIYDELPEEIKILTDEKVQEEVYARAERQAKIAEIEQHTAASRAAVLLNGGLA